MPNALYKKLRKWEVGKEISMRKEFGSLL